MREEISFMGITEAIPTDMLVAAMGIEQKRQGSLLQVLHIGDECCCCGHWYVVVCGGIYERFSNLGYSRVGCYA